MNAPHLLTAALSRCAFGSHSGSLSCTGSGVQIPPDTDPATVFRRIKLAELQSPNAFLTKLQSTGEPASPLLDHTQVLFGSNLGNASSHDTRNLPVLLFGGDFKHGQHLAFDRTNNTPLSNLFVCMLQGFGIETETFDASTGALKGLDLASL